MITPPDEVGEDGGEEWSRLNGSIDSIPNLNEITPKQALGYLNQSLVDLISIHESLPSELDTAAAIVNDQLKGESQTKRVHGHGHSGLLSPLTPLNSENCNTTTTTTTTTNQEGTENISPLNMTQAKNTPENSRPDSPENNSTNEALIQRRRRRSSALAAEASAVADVIKFDSNQDLLQLRGKSSPSVISEEDSDIYRSALSKRFWSKTPPQISTWKYLLRIHNYCPASTAVYLTCAVYIYRLCVVLKAVPLTNLCVHRLVLACLRVASKSLEDINYAQKRYSMVGGVSSIDLYRLEIALLFLLDFDIKVDNVVLEQCLRYIVELNTKAANYEQGQEKDENKYI